tara:strand:+ start:1431 stop:3227 length:1797 start_codon:yes stop_codon:yes gene_type:complete
MATTQYRKPTKAAVAERVATDDQIFKKLNRTMNGLDKPINKTNTIQMHPEAVKPDGTVAQTDDDIKLIEGKPIRTPKGLLEYREEKENENFPIKVSMETTKYEAESFYAAIHENFEHFLQGFNQTPIVVPNITVTAGPTLVKEEVVVNATDPGDIDQSTDDPEIDRKTASEEFGEEYRIITEINSAGDFTGIQSNTMYVVWRGIRYRFEGEIDGERLVPGDAVHTTELTNGGKIELPTAAKNPGPIKGLTNSYSGRNLEVFLKERDMSYDDIEVVPAAEVKSFLSMYQLRRMDVYEAIEWNNTAEADGFTYNKNSVIIDDIEYEPGDLIETTVGSELPTLHERWTEYHTHDVGKPPHRGLVYKATADEIKNKVYEKKPIRGYSSGKATGYYLMMEGEIYKTNTVATFFLASLKELPPGTNWEGNNNYDEYHETSYIAMDWASLRKLGTPGNKPVKNEKDPSLRVTLAQHYDGGGWSIDLPTGKYRAAGTNYSGFDDFPGFVNNDASYINVPRGLSIEIYDEQPDTGGSRDFNNKTYVGPTTVNLPGNKNDDVSSVRVFYTEGIEAPAGYRGTDAVKRYAAQDDFYKKPHLSRYNNLFK